MFKILVFELMKNSIFSFSISVPVNQSSMSREMWSMTFERSPALMMSCCSSSMTGRGGVTGEDEAAREDVMLGGRGVGLDVWSLWEEGGEKMI